MHISLTEVLYYANLNTSGSSNLWFCPPGCGSLQTSCVGIEEEEDQHQLTFGESKIEKKTSAASLLICSVSFLMITFGLN